MYRLFHWTILLLIPVAANVFFEPTSIELIVYGVVAGVASGFSYKSKRMNISTSQQTLSSTKSVIVFQLAAFFCTAALTVYFGNLENSVPRKFILTLLTIMLVITTAALIIWRKHTGRHNAGK